RERDDDVETSQRNKTQRAQQHETCKVESTTPSAAFAERKRRNANYFDTVPVFATRKALRRIVITAIACDNCDVVTSRRQCSGEIREVLGRGNHIRVEALVEKQD